MPRASGPGSSADQGLTPGPKGAGPAAPCGAGPAAPCGAGPAAPSGAGPAAPCGARPAGPRALPAIPAFPFRQAPTMAPLSPVADATSSALSPRCSRSRTSAQVAALEGAAHPSAIANTAMPNPSEALRLPHVVMLSATFPFRSTPIPVRRTIETGTRCSNWQSPRIFRERSARRARVTRSDLWYGRGRCSRCEVERAVDGDEDGAA